MNPLYWFCQGYYRLGLLFSARVSQWQELRADRLSARVCGGRLSVATLLKEWMATSQFALTVAEYEELLATAVPMPKANIFEMFVSRWREISSEGCKYLQRRLTEEERLSPWDSHPTMQRRIDAISQMPDSGPENGTPAWGLVRNLVQVEDQLHERLFGRQVDQRKPAKAWETRVCVADGFSSVRSRAEH